MKFFTTFILCIFIISGISGQKPTLEWEKLYGGYKDDVAKSVIQADDGSFFICGSTNSMGAGNMDALLVRLDATGNEIWKKTLGGAEDDEATCVIQIHDGNYVISGTTASKGRGKEDFWIIKMDENGKVLWEKTNGGDKSDAANSVIQTFDNGYVVCGYTKSRGEGGYDGYVIKLDDMGERIWRKTYGGSSRDNALNIIQNEDSTFVFCGFSATKSAGSYDFWISKINMKGKEMWDRRYGAIAMEEAFSIIPADEETYIICGYQLDQKNQNYNVWLMKLDKLGEQIWQRKFGENRMEKGHKVIPTSDGNFVICGFTSSVGSGKQDIWIIKVNDKGKLIWETTFGGEENENAFDISETSDGGYIICGTTDSKGEGKDDFYIIKLKGK